MEEKMDMDDELLEYESDSELMADICAAARGMLDLWQKDINSDLSLVYMRIYQEINLRLEESRPFRNFNLCQMAEKCKLTQPQVFILILSCICLYDGRYCEIYSKLEGDKRCFYLTKNLAFKFCHNIWGGDNLDLDFVLGDDDFYRLFFEKNQLLDDEFRGIKSPLRIRKDIYEFIFGKADGLLEDEYISEYYDGFSKLGDIKGRNEELERFYCLRDSSAFIAVTGQKQSGRRFLIKHSALKLGNGVIFADFETVSSIGDYNDTKEEIERLFIRGRLLGAWVCLTDFDNSSSEDMRLLKLFVKYADKFDVRFVMTGEEYCGARVLTDSRWVNIEIHRSSASETYELWNGFLGEYDTDRDSIDISQLAGKYKLSAGDIKHVLDSASYIAKSMGRERITALDISASVKQRNTKALGKFAELLDNGIRRDELVVGESTAKQLEYIENRLKYRNLVDGVWGFDGKVKYGKGVCALFYGPPGTGKTMAARVLANELGLELYRVDLSRMISKYIGETQKNITELFDRAKGVNALLFFDEADAMFAKRTQVSDSHDRNANSEVAHLLQKLEEYDGISILATNLKDNIDDAFKRRIKYMVYFTLPDANTRSILWKKMIPENAPVEDVLDTQLFARNFEMSGSEIKDAMLHAAYMAARENEPISNSHIMEAVKLSFAKYGKVLKKEDFGYLGF